jgi:hypothetical protein
MSHMTTERDETIGELLYELDRTMKRIENHSDEHWGRLELAVGTFRNIVTLHANYCVASVDRALLYRVEQLVHAEITRATGHLRDLERVSDRIESIVNSIATKAATQRAATDQVCYAPDPKDMIDR